MSETGPSGSGFFAPRAGTFSGPAHHAGRTPADRGTGGAGAAQLADVFLGSLSRHSGRICPAGHAGQRGGPGSGLHNGTSALLCGSLRACSQLRAAYPRRRNYPPAPSFCRYLRQFQQGTQGNLPASGKSPFRTSVLPPFGFTGMETAFACPGKQRPTFHRRGTGLSCPGGI